MKERGKYKTCINYLQFRLLITCFDFWVKYILLLQFLTTIYNMHCFVDKFILLIFIFDGYQF